MNIQINLKSKWQLKEFNDYKWSECKQLVNSKTGKIINKPTKGVSYLIYEKIKKLNK
jgi:hypothetical protein